MPDKGPESEADVEGLQDPAEEKDALSLSHVSTDTGAIAVSMPVGVKVHDARAGPSATLQGIQSQELQPEPEPQPEPQASLPKGSRALNATEVG